MEALAKATEHVDKLATSARGYQDGVRFPDKIAAVERLARFLMGDDDETEDVSTISGEDWSLPVR
jgi:hypothetical protein